MRNDAQRLRRFALAALAFLLLTAEIPLAERRSGYEFAVSPSGVKRDYIIYNDNQEDGAWDAVWDVGTTVDSLGWTAEFRIPLSQLRYANAESHTFGFGVWRDIERHKERVSWPAYRETKAGISSQLGELSGISGLSSPRRLEMAPYDITRGRISYRHLDAAAPAHVRRKFPFKKR